MAQHFIGLMSGTSMDGIDSVIVDLASHFQIVQSHTHPIPLGIKQALQQLCLGCDHELSHFGKLDHQMGLLFAQACNQLLIKSGLSKKDIIAIGSHGQTIRHQPLQPYPYTLQLGDPNIIAELTGITTVADFRRRDMALGGQGAPLVPAFHRFAFHCQEHDRIIVNIGGIANLTFLPANPLMEVKGFDCGPGNALLDAWINDQRGMNYDKGGNWAGTGLANPRLLNQLLKDKFLTMEPPKSIGKEYYNLRWLSAHLNVNDLASEDIQATLAEYTALCILSGIAQVTNSASQIILCGGGVHNIDLVNRIKHHADQHMIYSSQDFGIDPDWVEAVAFAWLARQTLLGNAGNLPTVTGATAACILGAIYPSYAEKEDPQPQVV